MMRSWLRRFWDAICFGGLLLGLVYMPADLYGLSETYPWLERIRPTVDRFDLIVVFATLTVLYIFWADIRPSVIKWLRKTTPHPLTVTTDRKLDIYVTKFILNGTNESLHKYEYVLSVRNDSYRTVRNVLMQGDYYGNIDSIPLFRMKGETVDIRPGAAASYLIASVVSEHEERLPGLPDVKHIEEQAFQGLRFLRDHRSIWVARGASAPIAIMSDLREWSHPPTLDFQICGDDVPAIKIVVTPQPGPAIPFLGVEQIESFHAYDQEAADLRLRSDPLKSRS